MYQSDKIASIFLTACFTAIYFLSKDFPDKVSVYPRGLAIIGIITSIALLINTIGKENKKDFERTVEYNKLSKVQVKKLVFTGVFTIIYIFMIPIVGYTISTFIFMFSLMQFLKPWKKLNYIIISAIFALSLYSVFGLLLKIWLPRGILF